MNRKQRRAATKAAKKQGNLEGDLAEKMLLFDKLPEACSACTESFDKKNREMVMTWNVVVRHDEETVRLYCPECWAKAVEAIQQLHGVRDELV